MMKNRLFLTLLSVLVFSTAAAQNKPHNGKSHSHDAASLIERFNPAYLLYNNDGKMVSFSEMVETLSQNDVVFIGEYHNSSVAHWLELEIFSAIAAKHDNKVTLGMEMMESDRQDIIDEYMQGLIVQERFYAETYLWPNYKMDYAPMVELAKANDIRLIATNVPRRYARVISTDGVDKLRSFPESSQQYYGAVLDRVASMSEPNSFYGSAMISMGNSSNGGGQGPKGGQFSDEQKAKMLRMTQAQGLKDAVMAMNIANNLEYPFVHINGNYHSDKKAGIITFLLESKPELKIATISTVYQEDLTHLDEKNHDVADFYIVLPNNTHKTY